jgi:hypothetical protein
MLVPAIALAWCVLSLPPRSVDASETGPSVAQAHAARHAGDDGQGERVMPRGPIPAEVIAFAKTLVNLPMGAEQFAEINGQKYVFVLERHFHPIGFVGAPNGWHKGVTAYELH